jgi:hypothetical protein
MAPVALKATAIVRGVSQGSSGETDRLGRISNGREVPNTKSLRDNLRRRAA